MKRMSTKTKTAHTGPETKKGRFGSIEAQEAKQEAKIDLPQEPVVALKKTLRRLALAKKIHEVGTSPEVPIGKAKRPGRRRKVAVSSEAEAMSAPAAWVESEPVVASAQGVEKKRRGRRRKVAASGEAEAAVEIKSAQPSTPIDEASAPVVEPSLPVVEPSPPVVEPSPLVMDMPFLQALWFARQGLPHTQRGTVAEVLERTGWLHTGGGQLPYIALFARARLPRAGVDEALAAGSICEVPAVRGCTMLVPACDVALALWAGRASHETGEVEVARKHCGLTDQELGALCAGVLDALAGGPLEPHELHQQLGAGLIRSLGDIGKKKGFATTLPIALGRLEGEGQVRRISLTGRLDTQRHRYALWQPGPFDGGGKPLSRPAMNQELARRYLRWVGPATAKDFAVFAGIALREARQALTALDAIPVGPDTDRLLPREDLAALHNDRPPRSDAPSVAFVPYRDHLTHLRRDLAFVDPALGERRVPDWEHGQRQLSEVTRLHLPAILDRGRLIGFWDYDDQKGRIVWASLMPLDRSLRQAVYDELAAMQSFIRDELGDARFNALDKERNRRQRLESIEELGRQVGSPPSGDRDPPSSGRGVPI